MPDVYPLVMGNAANILIYDTATLKSPIKIEVRDPLDTKALPVKTVTGIGCGDFPHREP
jgi:hypothetical protein